MSGLIIDSEACIGCGRCEDVCWHQGIEIKERKAYKTDKCIGCGICTTKCEFDAIHLKRVRPQNSKMIPAEDKFKAILPYMAKREIKIRFAKKEK